uniref:NADH-ubiquinone oxidoreductase chain 3 n=1 Tax=Scotoplanes sp. H5 TaxID=2302361 RepID=A0A3G9GQP4_9ECHN|nr:NADH dehydrogenase subunit 3 [Scotoplanes sp. H5]
MNLLIFFLLALTLSLLLIFISHFLPSRINNINKNAPYECGFDPINSSRLPFSFRFFLIAILFLIFDLEIILLIPLITNSTINILSLLNFSSIFLIILVLGLYYEWIQGGLEWAE